MLFQFGTPLPKRRGHTPPRPPKRPRKRPVADDYARRKSRRARLTATLLTVSLLALSGGIWMSPQVRRWSGDRPDLSEVALVSERARAADLRRQNAALSQRLKTPRPPITDDEQRARADDLARQVEELEAKLNIHRPTPTDRSQEARAEDLQRRLREAQARLAAPRTQTTDGSQRARAEDLARQVDALSAKLAAPRTTLGRFAGVTANRTKADIVASQHQFGLYTAQAPFNWGEAGMVEDTVQRKANIVGYFQDWNDPFRADAIQLSWQRHQVPMLTWEPAPTTGRDDPNNAANLDFNLPSIIAGHHDDYIRTYARGIRDLGMPVILRLAHEMNGDWYPWSETQRKDLDHDGDFDDDERPINGNVRPDGTSRGLYAEMWRHVHDIFQAEGANEQTVWLWAPNRVNNITSTEIRQPSVDRYYPGDDYVDWMGMSGYLRYSDRNDPPTFDMTFGDTLAQLRSTSNKRIFLAEIGATELNGTKTQWITSLFAGLNRNPDITGFAWFSLTVSAMKGDGVQTNDWRINSTGPARDALAAGLAAGEFGLPTG